MIFHLLLLIPAHYQVAPLPTLPAPGTQFSDTNTKVSSLIGAGTVPSTGWGGMLVQNPLVTQSWRITLNQSPFCLASIWYTHPTLVFRDGMSKCVYPTTSMVATTLCVRGQACIKT
jgi:hypothetical protein